MDPDSREHGVLQFKTHLLHSLKKVCTQIILGLCIQLQNLLMINLSGTRNFIKEFNFINGQLFYSRICSNARYIDKRKKKFTEETQTSGRSVAGLFRECVSILVYAHFFILSPRFFQSFTVHLSHRWHCCLLQPSIPHVAVCPRPAFHPS